VFYAYGSYRPVGNRVITPSFVIAFLDFLFSLIAGFIVWAGLAILVVKQDAAAFQTSATGLTFIAFPRLADVSNSMGQFQAFMFFMWISGIDSAISYMQGWVANLTDKDPAAYRMYPLMVFGQCATGYALCMLFCSNWGWILFDLVDHYITDYVILLIGVLQCVAVGWVLEYESTAVRSEAHRESLRHLAAFYWIPVIAISFYSNFAFAPTRWIAAIVFVVCLIFSCGMSVCQFRATGLDFDIWYAEIFLCGVNKVALSVSTTPETALDRGFFVRFFEFYFGLAIKYLNPAILIFLMCENLAADLAAPYAEQPQNMTVFGTMFVFILACMICSPAFLCGDIEESQDWLKHMTADDVNGEFISAPSAKEGDNFETKHIELPES